MKRKHIFAEGLFVGKRAVISGGGTGIGFHIAKLLGSLGAHVILVSRNVENLQKAVNTLHQDGIKADYERVNIRNEQNVEQLFVNILNEWNGCDFLVNNAGGQFVAPALNISPNGFRAVVDLNLQGTWHMNYYFAHMLRDKEMPGCIVNIVLSQKNGFPSMMHASAARAGVVNMTKTLAYEWADYGIRINTVAPGTIDTSGLEQYDKDETMKAISRLPIKRMGTPKEIAESVAYLLSPAGDYITGTTLEIDGGEHLLGATKLK